MRRTLSTLLLTLVLVMTGCRAGTVASDASGRVARSRLQHDLAPAADADDVRLLTSANSEFAVDLYGALRRSEGNLFFSPHSIAQALAMTYAGAEGETERQMREVMRLELLGDKVHPAYNALGLALASRAEQTGEYEGTGFRLHVANALWAQQGKEFRTELLDLLASQYDAGVRLVDYVQAAEKARGTINAWVADQTEGHIRDLIPAGALNELTRLVLTNAIYFQASWREPFNPARTTEAFFFPPDGSKVTVPMMRQEERLRYVQSAGYRAVELPYISSSLVMTIIVPDPGRFDAFQGALDGEQLGAILASLDSYALLDLGVPRFHCESAFSLREALGALGMKDAFEPGIANFSGMDGSRDLFVSEVVHKAFVDVSEAGTEAAAATAVVAPAGAMPEQPIPMIVDQPFLFLIRDVDTGAILFMGRVIDPTR